MSKYCKVCRAPSDELDTQGRCRSCAVALAATNAGMHYGDYMALQGYHEPFRPIPVDVAEEKEEKKCLWCGAIIPPGSRQRKYCSWDCWHEKDLVSKREWSRNHFRGKGINDG